MKIDIKVIGPAEGLKGLFVAEGTNDIGQKCSLLVKQNGENAALALHSSKPSTIGAERVIAYRGTSYAKAEVRPGAKFKVEVNPLLKPSAQAKGTEAETIAKQGEQIAELSSLVRQLMDANAAPAQESEEPKTE